MVSTSDETAANDSVIDARGALDRLQARYDGSYGEAAVWRAQQEVEEKLDAGGELAAEDQALLLDAVAAIREVRRQLDTQESSLLRLAHDRAGMSLTSLAPALGVKSRQAVEQRYRRRVDFAKGRDLKWARSRQREKRAGATWAGERSEAVDQAIAAMTAVAEAAKNTGNPLRNATDLLMFAGADSYGRYRDEDRHHVLMYAGWAAKSILDAEAATPGTFDSVAVANATLTIKLSDELKAVTRRASTTAR